MEPSKFDELTKALVAATSPRQALKTIAATTLGSILGIGGIGTAFAKCKSDGHSCGNNKQCCSGICQNHTCVSLTSGTCPSTTGGDICSKTVPVCNSTNGSLCLCAARTQNGQLPVCVQPTGCRGGCRNDADCTMQGFTNSVCVVADCCGGTNCSPPLLSAAAPKRGVARPLDVLVHGGPDVSGRAVWGGSSPLAAPSSGGPRDSAAPAGLTRLIGRSNKKKRRRSDGSWTTHRRRASPRSVSGLACRRQERLVSRARA